MLDIKDYLFKLSDDQKTNLIAEDVDMSDKDKNATMVLFESSVNGQIQSIHKAMVTDFENELEVRLEDNNASLNEKINDYLKYVVEDWAEENKADIQASIRGQLNEKFIEGIKGVFQECYMDIPDERIDALRSVSEELDTQTVKFDKLFEENIKLKAVALTAQKALVAEQLTSDLADTQKEKAALLLESINADNIEDFEASAKTVLEAKLKVQNDDEGEVVTEDTDPSDDTDLSAKDKYQKSLVNAIVQESIL